MWLVYFSKNFTKLHLKKKMDDSLLLKAYLVYNSKMISFIIK